MIEDASGWRAGRIVVRDGNLWDIRRRYLPGAASVVQAIWQAGWGRSTGSDCVIDYHTPWGMPAFLTLDYMRSGRMAGYRSFCKAVQTLEAIAEQRNAYAIVAHITNSSITDRLLRRWGWQPHCLEWKGRHWIKRLDPQWIPRI